MKKIYLSCITIALASALNAQDAFWTVTNYRGAFPITDGTTATDWTAGWSNFDPQTTVYPATVTTVSTDVLTNTTWSGVIKLQNKIYVKNNATLTILPGTIIRGDKLSQATLIVTRGAKIYANGTATNPVIFTSNEAVGTRLAGDWGGLVLLGLAKNNQPGGVANIEGIVPTTDTQFGGNFDNDNSGSLTYVRIEFAGIALEVNKEINGLTCGSVGSATVIDYVQVSNSGDDSFEWFGGTVNCKHLIAYRGLDDDFDTDYGYRGKIQFGLAIRDKDVSDAIGDSNSFESDNDAAGSTAQPKTKAVFSNMTLVGPKGNGTIALPVGEKFEKAFRLRRNTAVSCLNSLVTGWEKGLSVESTTTAANVTGDTLMFANNTMTNFANGVNVITSAGISGAFYAGFYGVDGNDSTNTLSQVNWVNIFTALGTTPDARLNTGSVAGTTASFTNPKFFSIAAPSVTNTATYCQNALASAITGTSLPGNTLYYYTVAVGGLGSMTPIIPSTTTPGVYTYYISQKNSAGDESPRAMVTVTVNALPATPTISASGSTTFCTGGSVDLTSSSTTGNLWSNGSIASTITVSNSGSFSVTVTDGNSCSATSTSINVNVSNAPIPTITATTTSACSGDTVILSSSAADSYVWSTGQTTQSIALTATSANITVTTVNVNACNGVGMSQPTSVTFTATPTAAGSFTTNGNVATFTNTSTGAGSYSWDFGDFSNSSASAPTHAYAANGAYTVTLTAINGNCTSTTTFTVNISVALDELQGITLNLYPNPANQEVNIALNGAALESVVVIDQFGRTVKVSNVSNINVSDLASGVYQVIIYTDKGNITRRLVVSK
jgi:PKD repeat protein